METISDDCLIIILKKLSLNENVHLESVCKRWRRVLKTPTIYAHMKKVNISDYLGNNPLKHFDESNDELVVKIEETLKRGGQFVQTLSFDSRWLNVTQPVIDHISNYCKNLKRLDIGCVVLNADVSPLLCTVGEHLEELLIDESRWIDEENAIKFTKAFNRLKILRKIDLRKFDYPLEAISELPKTLNVDLSDANGLSPEVLVEFIDTHPELEKLVLSPMPQPCLKLFSTSTTTVINQSNAFTGFVKQNFARKKKEKERNTPNQVGTPNKVDLQMVINALKKLKSLKSLSIGYIKYTPQFLSMEPISHLENLKNLSIKDCNAINSDVLKTILKKMKELRSLTLQNCAQIEDHMSIAMCKEIIDLEIENNPNFSNMDIEKISQNNKFLKRLRLKNCPKITDVGVMKAAKNCPIREIDLSNCENVSEQIFAQSEPYSELLLEVISLRGCKAITKNSIQQMLDTVRLEKLRELDISLNKNMDDTIVEEIAKKLKQKLERKNKPLVLYAFNTGITKDVEKRVAPDIEIMF